MHLDDLEIFIYRKKTKYMRLRIGLTPPNLSPTLMANLAQNLFKQAPKSPYISLTCPKVASAEQQSPMDTPDTRQNRAKKPDSAGDFRRTCGGDFAIWRVGASYGAA